MGAKQSSANVTFSKPGTSADKSGYIWVAPLGTAVPTNATAELDKAFVGLGYLSEDGLTEPASFEPGDDIAANTTDGSITIKEQAGDIEHHVIVIDEMLKGGRKRRNVMADATFLITGDISHVHTALVNFEFTITAYPTATQPAQTQYITIPKKA